MSNKEAYAAGYMIPNKGDKSKSSGLKLPSVRPHLQLSTPADKVLLVTLNRPEKFNAMTDELQADLRKTWDFFEQEPSLWVAVLTGNGRGFCAGQDLSIWLENQKTGKSETELFRGMRNDENPSGFGGMSLRRFKKPVIAAVNGGAHGGGCEMLLNCDMVIAGERTKISLPEPLRGVAAFAGGISRLYQAAGHALAGEAMLTGRAFSAQEARDRLRIVNYVVPEEEVLKTAIEWAVKMTKVSPDSLYITKEGMNMTSHDNMGDTQVARALALHPSSYNLLTGANCREGLESFKERREPRWENAATILNARQSKL